MLCVKIAEKGKKVTENFSEDEFACRCCGSLLLHPELLRKLEAMRFAAGAPVIVTSGYRCQDYNKVVGGAANSYHTFGMAADVFVNGVSTQRLAELAEDVGFDGIGIYPDQAFVHVDVRGYRTRWEG